MQHFSQIAPRGYTLVLFITAVPIGDYHVPRIALADAKWWLRRLIG